MEELKKCPFCGGEDIGVKETLEDINFTTGNVIKIWAYCRNCGATCGFRTIHDCSEKTKIDLAYNKWNERTTTEAEIRAKAIDEFFDELQKYEDDDWLKLKMSSIYEITQQLKEE